MKLIHLTTLDGSTEASVARLDALERQYENRLVQDALDDIESAAEELHEYAMCSDLSDADYEYVGNRYTAVRENLCLLDLLLDAS